MAEGICSYCGCGCKLEFEIKDGKVVRTTPSKQDRVSHGKPCVKGLTLHESFNTDRITEPLIRNTKDDKFKQVSWEKAVDFIAQQVVKIAGQTGEDNMRTFLTSSGEFSNETNYLIHKMARQVFGTVNVDSCARLCHAATGVAWEEMFGIKAIPTYTFDDLKDADLYFYIGTDPADDYPVMFQRTLDSREESKIVLIDVATTTSGTSKFADFNIEIDPDDIIPVTAYFMSKIVESAGGEEQFRRKMSEESSELDNEGITGVLASIESVRNEFDKFETQLDPEMVKTIVQIFLNPNAKKVIGYGMGITQHPTGVENVVAVTDLAILTNSIVFPGRGKVNVQGADDITACFTETDKNSKLPAPLTLTDAMYSKDMAPQIFFSFGMNPYHSMPDLNRLEKTLQDTFLIYMHHHAGATMDFANVVLPARMLSEEEGTITNAERLLRFSEGLPSPVPHQNWEIIQMIAKAVSRKWTSKESTILNDTNEFTYSTVNEVMREWLSQNPFYQNISVVKLLEVDGQELFADKEPKWKKLQNFDYKKPYHKEYKFVATTARSKFHFCSGEGTRHSKMLNKMHPENCVYINNIDAKELGLNDGDALRISSSVGEITLPAKVDKTVQSGVVLFHYHFDKVLVNKITPLLLDLRSGTPCYKFIPVELEVVREGEVF